METKEFILAAFQRAKGTTMRALDGLTADELKWRPGPEANSIGLIFFHQVRSEDRFIQNRIKGEKELFEAEKWHEKWNMTPEMSGAHFTVEQLAAFRVPDKKDLLAYAEAVRAATVAYLKDTRPADFDRVINLARLGDISIGNLLAMAVVHDASHAGDISFLRGLQRGLDK